MTSTAFSRLPPINFISTTLAAILAVARSLEVVLASDQFLIRDTTAGDVLQRGRESVCIGQAALIEPERLLVEIPEQVEGLDAHVGALERALEQRPVVFKAVRVDLSVDVFL